MYIYIYKAHKWIYQVYIYIHTHTQIHTQMNIEYTYTWMNEWMNIYIYIYQVKNDCEYPKKESSMHGYLIQNIPTEQNKYFCLKTRNLEIVCISIYGMKMNSISKFLGFEYIYIYIYIYIYTHTHTQMDIIYIHT